MQALRLRLSLPRNLGRRPGSLSGARSNQSSSSHTPLRRNLWVYPTILLLTSGTVWFAYKPIRHSVLAGLRCYRVVAAAGLGIIEFKVIEFKTSFNSFKTEDDRLRCVLPVFSTQIFTVLYRAVSECHTRSAYHVLKALLANGGIFIKVCSIFTPGFLTDGPIFGSWVNIWLHYWCFPESGHPRCVPYKINANPPRTKISKLCFAPIWVPRCHHFSVKFFL
jgi:hypothetical protein